MQWALTMNSWNSKSYTLLSHLRSTLLSHNVTSFFQNNSNESRVLTHLTLTFENLLFFTFIIILLITSNFSKSVCQIVLNSIVLTFFNTSFYKVYLPRIRQLLQFKSLRHLVNLYKVYGSIITLSWNTLVYTFVICKHICRIHMFPDNVNK
jgi:hypothetical protein